LLEDANIEQRLVYPASYQAATHGTARLIKYPQQRTLDGATAPGFKQFKIAARMGIEGHKAISRVRLQRGELMQEPPLGLLHIRQYCPRCSDSQGEMGTAKAFQGGDFKVCEQAVARIILAEIASIVGGDVPGNTRQ